MIDRAPGLALGADHAAARRADLRASRTKRSRLGEPAVAHAWLWCFLRLRRRRPRESAAE